MAQRAVEAAIQAFQRGMQMVNEKQAREQELEERKNEREERKSEFEQSLKQQQAHFDAQQKANAAIFDLQQQTNKVQNLAAGQQMGRIYTETGALPPGATQTPIQQQIQVPGAPGGGVSGPFINIPGQTIPQNMTQAPSDPTQGQATIDWGVPGMPQSIVRTPEAQRALLAKEEEEKQAPITAARLKEIQLTQEDQMKRMIQVAGIEHGYRVEENAAKVQADKDLERMRGGFQLQAARIRSSMAGADALNDAVDMPTLKHGGMIGAISADDVKSRYGKWSPQINADASKDGVQFLPKKSVDQLNAIRSMVNLMPDIRNSLNLSYSHPYEVNNPFSKVGQDYGAYSKNIQAKAMEASVALTGVRRFNQNELNNFTDYFKPDISIGRSNPQSNLIKYNSFHNDLDTAIGNMIKGLSPTQQQGIISSLESQGYVYGGQRGDTKKPGQVYQGPSFEELPNKLKSGGGITQWEIDPGDTTKLRRAGGGQ